MIHEAISYARYFVRNRFAYAVVIAARDPTGPWPLRASVVEPGATVHIADVAEGTGGHVMPSNFFSAFSITPVKGGAPVYSGVRNADWHDEGSQCGRERYLLVVGP